MEKGGRPPQTVESITDGDRIPVGDAEMEAFLPPGHTAVSSWFILDGSGEAFVGDTVLPVYTPTVGGADVRLSRPRAVSELAPHAFTPKFRTPLAGPPKQHRSAWRPNRHHRNRTNHVLEVLLEAGTADA